ncbi:glycoside hydrolase superfamily [Gongronella butleri]|nr:glycoside hydrolase superfamily [Gongronella butleri]
MIKSLLFILTTSAAFLLASAAPLQERDAASFVRADGAKFTLGGSDFYFAGTNALTDVRLTTIFIIDYLMTNSQSDVQSLIAQCSSLKLPVIRTWLFNLGDDSVWFQQWNSNNKTMEINDDSSTGLGRIDYIIQQASKSNVKLIFTLTNNWQDYGGMDYYVKNMGGIYHDDFYTNADIKAAYKAYIEHVLSRVNTLTNIAYKDDPTIFGWELANEPRCAGSGSVPSSSNCNPKVTTAWVDEMSAYIKSIDSNHLVAVGDEGFFNDPSNSDYYYNGGAGIDFDANLALSGIDFGTAHLYPETWKVSTSTWAVQWINDHANASTAAKKPVILEEYGLSTDAERTSLYPTWQAAMEKSALAGDNFWQIEHSPRRNTGAGTYCLFNCSHKCDVNQCFCKNIRTCPY